MSAGKVDTLRDGAKRQKTVAVVSFNPLVAGSNPARPTIKRR